MTLGDGPSLPAFSVNDALSHGWSSMKQNYGVLLGACLIAVAVNMAFTILQSAIAGDDIVLSTSVGLVPSLLVTTPLSVGLGYMGVLAARGERPSLGVMLAAFSHYGTIVALGFLGILLFAAATVPGLIGVMLGSMAGETGTWAGGVLGGLVGFVIYIYVIARVMFSGLICLDPQNGASGPIECLKASWKMTEDHVFGLIGLGLLLMLIVMGSFLLLCVGVFFLGYPLLIATSGAAYALVAGSARTS